MGDGSQDIYWHDPNVLYISMHQDGRTLYPGSGFTDEFGGPGALGLTLNVPLPPRTSDQGFLHAIENLILPVLDEFKPDLIVNSAGSGQSLLGSDHAYGLYCKRVCQT